MLINNIMSTVYFFSFIYFIIFLTLSNYGYKSFNDVDFLLKKLLMRKF